MIGETKREIFRLRNRFLLYVLLFLILGIGFSSWLAIKQTEDILVEDAVEDANLLAKSLEAFRKYYSDTVVPRAARAGMDVTHDFRLRDNALPLPFTLHGELSEQINKTHFGTRTRIFSDYPFPWNRDGGAKDQFERDALTVLRQSPDKPFTRLEGEGGDRVLRFAKADLMLESCIGCHNSSPDSPKHDWQVGDVAGVLSVSVPLNPEHRIIHTKLGAGYLLVATLLITMVIILYIANIISHGSIRNLERKIRQKMEELETSEESLESAQKVGKIGNWTLDIESRNFWASQGLMKLLNVEEEDFDGTIDSLVKHLHSEDRKKFRQCVEKAIVDATHETLDYRIILPDGELRFLHEESDVVVSPETGKKRLVGVVKDVTEKHDRELKLNMLSNALEQAGEAVLITDNSNNIRYVNKAFSEVTGYQPSEVIGKNPKLLSSGRHGHSFYKKMWREIKKRGYWKGRIFNKRKNGEIYPEQIHIRAIHDEHGDIANYAAVFSDITEQIRLEERLRESQKMEAVGTLVGGIAHDFNNILAAITGNLFLIRKDVEDRPLVMKKITTIEDEGFRAAKMISQLLTFARKDVIHMDEVSFTELYRGTKQLARVTVPESVKLVWEDCGEELKVDGDDNQLKQIILNLVNNARDAVEGVEDPTITVSLKRYEPDRDFRDRHRNVTSDEYICLEVSDNGCGIPRDTLEHVFEPFFTTKRAGQGTGLGLAMVYGSIQHHSGIMEVDSEVDKGSRFRIYLACSVDGHPESGEEITFSDIVPGKGETILVVDDEDMVRDVARDMLKSLDYRVLEASDGVSAVDVFMMNRERIALVLLDVVMPRMGGVQAARKIREVNPDMPIIFATGYDQDSVLAEVADWSHSTVIGKPYRAKQISKKIHKLLD